MRNKKYILLFISLLFFITNVKADNLNLDMLTPESLTKNSNLIGTKIPNGFLSTEAILKAYKFITKTD